MDSPGRERMATFRRHAIGAAMRARVKVAGMPDVRRSLSTVMKGMGAGIGYGMFIEPRWIERTQIEIAVPNLPAELDGYRIVHLTDIHFNFVSGEMFLSRVIESTNHLDPDLIALTGDFITHDAERMGPCLDQLAGLRAPDGLWAVRGNHDAKVPLRTTERLMNKAGINLLENRFESIRTGRERSRERRACGASPSMTIAGVGDLWTGPCHPGTALEGSDPTNTTVMLSHNPAAVRLLPQGRRVDLMLSGHTHGGQVRPFHYDLPMLSGGERTLVSGLKEYEGTSVYVSRGVGTSALHFRWNCRPEIALLILRRAGEPRTNGA